MRFKTGDKVRMVWKPRFGLPVSTWSELRPVSGVVVGVRDPGTSSSKLIIELATGGHVIQEVASDEHHWAAIEPKMTIGGRMRAISKRLFV